MGKAIHIVHAKQVITKLVNIVVLFVKEHRVCSKVADATSETLIAQGSCSEKNKSLIKNQGSEKNDRMSRNAFGISLSVLQASSFTAR